jgi:DNA (cytosine-5)-methyltransferase 1
VINKNVREFSGTNYRGIDLLAGGVPCPPFSVAGKQRGAADERDLFPQAIRLVQETRPQAVLLENVRGFASHIFISYRRQLTEQLEHLGYRSDWRILEACNFGVPQRRPRFVLVALRPKHFARFKWPDLVNHRVTVGQALFDLMAARGWQGVERWRQQAQIIAPTLVGGSLKHGGPDLGPTRARRQWLTIGIDGRGLANEPPPADFPIEGRPQLTLRMVARLQGFPDDWLFVGKKTAAYRQLGNAFPPPVAREVATAVRAAITGE